MSYASESKVTRGKRAWPCNSCSRDDFIHFRKYDMILSRVRVLGRVPGFEKPFFFSFLRSSSLSCAFGGSRTFDWRTLNEKSLNQARTGLFIQNLCETVHAGDNERVGIFILGSPKDFGRLYQMALVRRVRFRNFLSFWVSSCWNLTNADAGLKSR